MSDANDAPRQFRFSRAFRIQHKREFEAVFAAKARVDRGPLVVQTIPHPNGCSRLGLSVSRRIGGAVRRNRMKRLLRECFRLSRPDFPADYDVVVAVKPHKELPFETYRTLLMEAILAEHQLWTKRAQRQQRTNEENPRPDDGRASPPVS